ncbi:hypothetical protein ACFLQU_05045 [Verrucomicrobiota bacterium]
MAEQSKLGKMLEEAFVVRTRGLKRIEVVMVIVGIVLGIGAGCVLLATEGRAMGPWMMAAGLAAAALVVHGARGAKRRNARLERRVTLFENALIVDAGDQGRTVIHFKELVAVAFSTRSRMANGSVSGLDRHVSLWRSGDPPGAPAAELNSHCRLQKDGALNDRLVKLIDYLLDTVTARMGSLVRAGGRASGAGVSLSRDSFSVNGDSIPMAEITRTGVYSDRICIWRRGMEDAVCRLDLALPNAIPLLRTLASLLEESKPVRTDESGMGHLLFERKAGRRTVMVLTILGVLLLPAFGIGLLLLLVALGMRRSWLRCYERGATRSSMLNKRSVRYDDVSRLTYSATANYVNGGYTGTNIVMSLESHAGGRRQNFRYTTRVQVINDDLEAMRDMVANAVAERLRDTLKSEGEVEWVPAAVLRPGGIRCRSKGFGKSATWREFSADEIEGINLIQGYLHLFVKDSDKSVWHTPVNAPNFFPGMILLCEMLAANEARP